MYLFYNLILYLFSPLIFLFYLMRVLLTGKEKEGCWQRMGFLANNIYSPSSESFIWVHAVSVGEVMAAKQIVKECKNTFPKIKIMLSTITDSGQKIALSLKEADLVFYLPLDYKFLLNKIFKKKNILAIIIMETEIWPNLVVLGKKNNSKIILANGRFSKKSFNTYLKFKIFFKQVLQNFDLFLMQSKDNAEKIIQLGAAKNKVQVTGNTKYDISLNFSAEEIQKLKKEIGVQDNQVVILAGSTHKNEEEIILNVFQKLQKQFPNSFLIIAPRHLEREAEIITLLKKNNLSFNLRQLKEKNSAPIFILNTLGELTKFFALANLIILGGSFVPVGGHNILEPLSLGKVTIFGPHMENFKAILQDIQKDKIKAAIKVKDKEELCATIKYLLSKKNFTEELNNLGKEAQQLILKNKGASKQTILKLKELIKDY